MGLIERRANVRHDCKGKLVWTEGEPQPSTLVYLGFN